MQTVADGGCHRTKHCNWWGRHDADEDPL